MQNKANGRSAFIIIAGLLALTTVPARACDTSDCGRIVLAQNAQQQAQTDAAAAPEPVAETSKAGKKKSRHTKTSSGVEKAAEKSDKLATKTSAPEKKSSDKMFGADKTVDQGGRAFNKIETGKFDDNKSSVTPWADANAQMGPAPAGAARSAQDPIRSQPTHTTVTDSLQPMMTTAPPATPQAATADPVPTTDDDSQVVASDQLNDLDRAAETDQKPASKILRPTSQTAQAASASSDDAWSQTSLIGKIFIAFGGLLTLASAARMFIA